MRNCGRGVAGLVPLLGLAVALLAAPAAVAAQDAGTVAASDTVWVIRLADGTSLVGRVVAATADRVTFETAGGTRVEVPRAQIASLRRADGRLVDGAYWFADPNHTRLFVLAPTGRTLAAGEGYVSAFNIFLPFVAYGVTDAFTIAGATPILPTIIGRVFYVAPKLRVVHRPTFDASVGVLAFFVTQELDEGSAGLLYGVGTWGTTDRSVTAGAGWGYFVGRSESELTSEPVIMIGGDTRVARTMKLVTENYFVAGESSAVLSAAVRLFGERISVDLGIMGLLDGGDFDWVPGGNFVYNFGRRR
jgi:hypothetical protein